MIHNDGTITLWVSHTGRKSRGMKEYYDEAHTEPGEPLEQFYGGVFRGTAEHFQLLAHHLERNNRNGIYDFDAEQIRLFLRTHAHELPPRYPFQHMALLAAALEIKHAREDPRYHVLSEALVARGDYAILEHTIHEMSHAADLGLLPYSSATPREVGARLPNVEGAFEILSEAAAWGIEWYVLQTIGLDRIVTMDDVYLGAEMQDVSPDQLDRFLHGEGKGHAVTCAARVVGELHRLFTYGGVRW